MSILTLQTKIDFIENDVIPSFGVPSPFTFTSNDDYTSSRIAWIRTQIDDVSRNHSDAEKNQLMLLSNTIHTEEKAEEKLALAKAERAAERQFLLLQAQQAQQQQVAPTIEALLQQAGRTLVQPSIVSVMLDHYGSQVNYAVISRQYKLLDDYYLKAAKIPKTTTMRALGCEGYIMNGPLHGNENLIICFDLQAKPCLFKRLNNDDEKHRVYSFSLQRFSHPRVTSFEYRSGGVESAMIMPIFPSTLHSLTLNQRNSGIIGKLISQISDALEALHAIGYCHMDIKPSNIAIDNEGNFVLIDLGSVAPFNEPTECTDLFLPSEDRGTYGRYIATEKRDWLMLAMTVYSKLNSSNWDGHHSISSTQLITYLQSFEFANSLVEKINRI